MKFLTKHPLFLLAVGLISGIAIGLNVRSNVPSIPIQASATQGMDNFAIATGLIDKGVEGIYFLDHLTGDLKCAVINTKTGKFNSLFSYNVAADFGEGQQDAKYLMVTGMANIPRGRSGFQFANSVVYIAEASSGQIAAYAVPWNSGKQAAGKLQEGTFVPLDKQKFRTAVVRD